MRPRSIVSTSARRGACWLPSAFRRDAMACTSKGLPRATAGLSGLCSAAQQNGPANNTNRHRQQVHRAECDHCGEEIRSTKRSGRKASYCSRACKQAAFRARKWAGRYGTPDPLRNASKTHVFSSTSTGVFRGRGVDLGGVEPVVRERIIDLAFPGWKWAHELRSPTREAAE
jgi:hypothetical protein